MTEKLYLIGKNHRVSIISQPKNNVLNKSLPALVFLSGGLLHRIGPNRMFVTLARLMAQYGFLSARFDFSGVGDSPFSKDDVSFDILAENETIEIFDYLEKHYQISNFLVVGFCSGADIAYDLIRKEKRIIGFIGINGYYTECKNEDECDKFFSHLTNIRYYRYKMFCFKNWKRLFSGKSNIATIKKIIIKKVSKTLHLNYNSSNNQKFDLLNKPRCLIRSGCEYLFLYSEGSTAIDAFNYTFKKYLTEFNQKEVSIIIVKDADHLFTLQWYQNKLISLIEDWILTESRNWNSTNTTMLGKALLSNY